MQYKKIGNKYMIKLEKGEEIINSLTEFCIEHKIKSGTVSGIGGVSRVNIGYYDMDEEKYISKQFEKKNFEIISLNGNISLIENKPFPHLHILLGDLDYSVFGGHLNSAIISVTGEIVLSMVDGEVRREKDGASGLNLMQL